MNKYGKSNHGGRALPRTLTCGRQWRQARRAGSDLQRLGWVGQRAVAAQPRARLHQGGGLEVLDAFADLGRCGDQQRLELVGGLGTGLDRAAAGHSQRADRFHDPVAGLRDNGAGAAQRGSGGSVGIDRVGLALRAAGPAGPGGPPPTLTRPPGADAG